MYSTCTFCHASLGRNESLEHFPVGRRLAFDQATGRLWVVCPSCRQWNLTPLETRWEAIEDGERLYRDTTKRVATENIGLAKLRDGTELIRIGAPLRPEFAAWRYGDRFGTRWRKTALLVGTGVAATGAVAVAGSVALGAAVIGGVGLPYMAFDMMKSLYQGRLVVGRFVDEKGPLYVNAAFANLAVRVQVLDDPRGWGLRVPAVRAPHPRGRFAPGPSVFEDGRVVLTGENAEEATRRFLPGINSAGGRTHTVSEAVSVLEQIQSLDALVAKVSIPQDDPIPPDRTRGTS